MEFAGLLESLKDHLSDLRRVLIRSLIAWGVATIGSFFLSDHLFHILLKPYLHFATNGVSLQTLDPSETLSICFQISMITGVVLASPVLIRELWWFISPGLEAKERRSVAVALGFGLVLFIFGCIFSYFTVLPISLHFFWDFSKGLGVTPAWSVDNYFGFVMTTLVSFGIAFELPIVTTLLTYLGVLSAEMLSKGRRYAILIIFTIAAFLTPPDVLSQCLMGIPMLGLYELSILLARWVGRRAALASE